MVGSNIHLLKFKGAFTIWNRKMEIFFRTNFEIMLYIKYGFEIPRNEDREELKVHNEQ